MSPSNVHIAVRLLAAMLAAMLLAGCAAWDGPPDPGEALARYGVDAPPPEPPTHVASDVMLRRSGALLFRKGRYARAEQHIEPLLEKYPRHYLATAYMGLCRWFQGRPDETAALWRAYDNPALPGLGRDLAREAEGLRLLAERLRADRAFLDAQRGWLPPVAEGLVAVLDFMVADDEPDAMPPLVLGPALAALVQTHLEREPGLRAAPRDRVQIWRKALYTFAAEDQGNPLRARGLARLMGAEFAVTGELRPDPAAPGGVVLEMLVLPAEDPAQRRTRIQRRMNQALEGLEAVATEREALAGRRALYRQGLDHFDELDRLDGLLRRRDAAKERVRAAMESGHLEAGHRALADLDDLQARIEALHEQTGRFPMGAYQARLGRFHVDRGTLEGELAKNRAREAALAAEAGRLAERRLDLSGQLDRELPPHGVLVRVDLPPLMARAWPGMAARAVARALGADVAKPAAPDMVAMIGNGHDLARLIALGRALHARDRESWADSAAAMARAGDLAGPWAVQPPDDFSPDLLSMLDEAAMAETLEGRVMAIMTRQAGAFLASGGTAEDFERLAEGRGP